MPDGKANLPVRHSCVRYFLSACGSRCGLVIFDLVIRVVIIVRMCVIFRVMIMFIIRVVVIFRVMIMFKIGRASCRERVSSPV